MYGDSGEGRKEKTPGSRSRNRRQKETLANISQPIDTYMDGYIESNGVCLA